MFIPRLDDSVVAADERHTSANLGRYCLIAQTAIATVQVEVLDALGRTVAQGALVVSTAEAKSLEALMVDDLGDFLDNWRYCLVIGVSGGAVFFNTAGSGDPGVTWGVIATLAPTPANARPLLPGMVLG